MRLVAPLAAGLFLFACSSAELGPDAGGGSLGGNCQRACELSASAHCSFQTVAQCTKDCEEAGKATESKPDYCQQAYRSYIQCLAGITQPTCGPSGLDPQRCRADGDHYWNYCLVGLDPSVPCEDAPFIYNPVCAQEANHRPTICRGNVPAGCTVGGDSNFGNLYCCPGDPIPWPDAGTRMDASAVPGPDASAGPDAGTAPDAAWAPDAGGVVPGPDAGHPDAGAGADAALVAPDFTDEITACANGAACGWHGYPILGWEPLSNCVHQLETNQGAPANLAPAVTAADLWSCGRVSTDCHGFALCMTGQHGEAYCAAHPGGSCDGTKAVNCSSATSPADDAIDCNPSGNQCQLQGGVARCGIAQDCPQAGACLAGSSYWKCLDATATKGTGLQCPSGTSCKFSSAAVNPVCVGDTACSGSGVRCEGSVEVRCAQMAEFSYESRIDCAARKGYRCGANGCELTGKQCSAQSDACGANDVFQGCVMGWQVTYDCKAHGFARCGKNAKNIVTCVY